MKILAKTSCKPSALTAQSNATHIKNQLLNDIQKDKDNYYRKTHLAFGLNRTESFSVIFNLLWHFKDKKWPSPQSNITKY